VPHEGGPRWRDGALPLERVRAWLDAGAPDDAAPQLAVVASTCCRVHAARRPGEGGSNSPSSQVADGSARDVTRLTVFSSTTRSRDRRRDGPRQFQKPGEVAVLCRYLDAMRAVRLTYVEPRPDFVWPEPPATHRLTRASPQTRTAPDRARRHLHDRRVLPAGDARPRRPTCRRPTKPAPSCRRTPTSGPRPSTIARLRRVRRFLGAQVADLLRVGRKAMQPKGALALHRLALRRLAANAPSTASPATC